MMTETRNQFSLTRPASEPPGRAKTRFLLVVSSLSVNNRTRISHHRILIACLVLASLSGCCTSRHCDQNAGATVAKYQFQPESLRQAFEPATQAPMTNADILILSGGGSHGAWGAGVLRGWRDNSEKPRPKFRIVTGVSTGALLATYAFLGETNDDEILLGAYTTAKTSDIYRMKCPLAWPLSDSLYSSVPLRRMVARYISANTLARVAQAGRSENRRLYVGTVNLDSGKLVIWDMAKIAMDESNPNRLELYRRVVLASASIPVWVPPVAIDGALYGDGGVRAQLFVENHFLPALRDTQSHRKGQRKPLVHVRFYVVVNGKIGVDPVCEPDQLLGIGERTLDMILDAGEVGDLHRVYDMAAEMKSEGDRPPFWLARIPDGQLITSSYVFDPGRMKELYNAGVGFGREGTRWESTVPDPDRPGRTPAQP